MSNPAGIKDLWKNIDWKNKERKLAFFNKYFLKDKIVTDHVIKRLNFFKKDLIEFIQEGKIKENNKERKITNQDIINKLKGDR